MRKEVIISRSFLSPLLLAGEPALLHGRSRDKCWVVGTRNVSKKTSKCESKKKKRQECAFLLRHRSVGDLVPLVLKVRCRPTSWRPKPRCAGGPAAAPVCRAAGLSMDGGYLEVRHQRCSNFHLMCEKLQ